MAPWQDHSFPFPVFRNHDGLSLIICGQGMVRAAGATGAWLGRFSVSTSLVANFGIAGAIPKSRPLGTPVLLNKIKDQASGKSYFPERLTRSPWEETSCETWAKPVTAQPNTDRADHFGSPIFDMEAAAVFAVAEQYVCTSQLVFGKVVSDFLEAVAPSELKSRIKTDYEHACSQFLDYLRTTDDVVRNEPRQLRSSQALRDCDQLLDAIKEQLRLTVNQKRNLRPRLLSRILKSQSSSEVQDLKSMVLAHIKARSPQTKVEIRDYLQDLQSELERQLL